MKRKILPLFIYFSVNLWGYSNNFSYDLITEDSPAMNQMPEGQWQDLLQKVKSSGASVPVHFWTWLSRQINVSENQDRVAALTRQLSIPQKAKLIDHVATTANRSTAQNWMGNRHSLSMMIELAQESGQKNRLIPVLNLVNQQERVPAELAAALQSAPAQAAFRGLVLSESDSYVAPVLRYFERNADALNAEVYGNVFKQALRSDKEYRIAPADQSRSPAPGTEYRSSLRGWFSNFLTSHQGWPVDATLKAEVFHDFEGKQDFAMSRIYSTRPDLKEAHEKLYPKNLTVVKEDIQKETFKKMTRILNVLGGDRASESNWRIILSEGGDFWSEDILKALQENLQSSNFHYNYADLFIRLSRSPLSKLPQIQEFLNSQGVERYLEKLIRSGFHLESAMTYVLSRSDLANTFKPLILERLKAISDAKYIKALMYALEQNPDLMTQDPSWKKMLLEQGLASRDLRVRNEAGRGLLNFAARSTPALREHAAAIAIDALRANPYVIADLEPMSEGATEHFDKQVLAKLTPDERRVLLNNAAHSGAGGSALAHYISAHPSEMPTLTQATTNEFYRKLLGEVKQNPELMSQKPIADYLFSSTQTKEAKEFLIEASLANPTIRQRALPYLFQSKVLSDYVAQAETTAKHGVVQELINYARENQADLKPADRAGIGRIMASRGLVLEGSSFPDRVRARASEELPGFLKSPYIPSNRTRLEELGQAYKNREWVSEMLSRVTDSGLSRPYRAKLLELMSLDDELLEDKTVISEELSKLTPEKLEEMVNWTDTSSASSDLRDATKTFLIDHLDVLENKLSDNQKRKLLEKETAWSKLNEVFSRSLASRLSPELTVSDVTAGGKGCTAELAKP